MSCSHSVVGTSPGEPKSKKTKRGTAIEEPPELADGEDDISYQRHVKSLKAEWLKRRPNEDFVQQLMKLSYPHRRQWILSKPHLANDIFTECPFLATMEHVWP